MAGLSMDGHNYVDARCSIFLRNNFAMASKSVKFTTKFKTHKM